MSEQISPYTVATREYDFKDNEYKEIVKIIPHPETNSVVILFPMEQLAPDRIQYKPYGLGYTCGHVYVEVSVPMSEVKHYFTGQDVIVLTPRGAAMIADQLASALEESFNEFRNRNKTF